MTIALADRIDAILPQTQCTKCGYDGCRPYAQALAAGQAPINRCPPGGRAGIEKLARLLGQPIIALDPDCGAEGPHLKAWIDESVCIGCTKCIAACPVDAIIGAPKRMHTVIEALCSGCDLCIPACPVDCIEMRASESNPEWTAADGDAARRRMHARDARLARIRAEDEARFERTAMVAATGPVESGGGDRHGKASVDDEANRRKRAIIDAAVRKARARADDRVRR